MKDCSIWIGYDRRERDAYRVAEHSIGTRLHTRPIPIFPIELADVVQRGLYDRPTEYCGDIPHDVLSKTDAYDGRMSTEFAISRFLTPALARKGLALFADCDVMARTDVGELFHTADERFAVMCVKHQYTPSAPTKMDGVPQTYYARKNWSSVMLFNCEHPANRRLTIDLINSAPGRDLHAFSWLDDSEIGALDASWNHLVGEQEHDPAAKIVHFTNGGPWLEKYSDCPFADEWRAELSLCGDEVHRRPRSRRR